MLRLEENNKMMKTEIISEEQVQPTPEAKLVCPKCRRVFETQADMERHWELVSSKKAPSVLTEH
jgi:uncharacterized C2H2 Zn-finger protein